MRGDDILNTEHENKEVELTPNLVEPGEDINLSAKDPTLRKIMIGCGWDLNVFQGEDMDLDVSIFLLDKNGQTRKDDDFIFYNAMENEDKTVVHNGDNRTGAGDGDDETIDIDIQTLPYDILRIVIVVSIYQGYEKNQSLSRVKNAFIRLVNAENNEELMRFELSKELEEREHDYAMIAGYIDREGPKWHFRPATEFFPGGLQEIATNYGMLIKQQ